MGLRELIPCYGISLGVSSDQVCSMPHEALPSVGGKRYVIHLKSSLYGDLKYGMIVIYLVY